MIHGVDLSVWQQNVDYDSLARAVGFAYVKATDCILVPSSGRWVPFEDKMHQTHVLEMRKRGVPTGDYAFAHVTSDVDEHASFFVHHCWFDQLRPVIDMETLSQGMVPSNAGAWCLAWCENVEKLSGASPIIYASTSYAAEMFKQCSALSAWDIWLAQYDGTPPDHIPRGPWGRVVAWQWTGSGTLPGIRGNADRDVCLAIEPLLSPAFAAPPQE